MCAGWVLASNGDIVAALRGVAMWGLMWYLNADLRDLWPRNSSGDVGGDVVSERRFKDSLVQE